MGAVSQWEQHVSHQAGQMVQRPETSGHKGLQESAVYRTGPVFAAIPHRSLLSLVLASGAGAHVTITQGADRSRCRF
jgi:hypothetical protein